VAYQNVSGIDPATGTVLWEHGAGASTADPIVSGNKMWVTQMADWCRVLDLANGKLYVSSDAGNLGLVVCYDVGSPNQAPAITDASGATGVGSTSATLNGELVSEGTAATTVSVYWGTTDDRPAARLLSCAHHSLNGETEPPWPRYTQFRLA
jgi:outer membrane protein assembly factor BamB